MKSSTSFASRSSYDDGSPSRKYVTKTEPNPLTHTGTPSRA